MHRWSNDRKLYVSLSLRKRAAEDIDFCKALTLAVQVKAEYTSSTINDFTIHKLQKILHTQFSTARQALDCALKYKLAWFDNDRHGKDGKKHKDLHIAKLSAPNEKAVKLNICYPQSGPQIFLKSNFFNVETHYINSQKPQTFKQVQKVIWLTTLACADIAYTKGYDAQLLEEVKSHGLKRVRADLSYSAWRKFAKQFQPSEPGKVNMLNGGYSYEAMSYLFKDNLSINQIRSVVKLGVDCCIFNKEANYICVRELKDYQNEDFGYDLPENPTVWDMFKANDDWQQNKTNAECEDWLERDKYGNITTDYNKRGFKRFQDGKAWLYTRAANSYFYCGDVVGKKSDGTKNRKKYHKKYHKKVKTAQK